MPCATATAAMSALCIRCMHGHDVHAWPGNEHLLSRVKAPGVGEGQEMAERALRAARARCHGPWASGPFDLRLVVGAASAAAVARLLFAMARTLQSKPGNVSNSPQWTLRIRRLWMAFWMSFLSFTL